MNKSMVLSMDEVKKVSLEGLLFFHELCQKNELKYYLAYGTLLGAFRHGGFIPWDDDIDVIMHRKDFEVLHGLAKTIHNSEWEVLSYRNEPDFLFSWIKICNKKTVLIPPRLNNGFVYGVCLDVFCLDDLPYCDIKDSLKWLEDIRKEMYRKENLFYRTANVKTDCFNRIKGGVKRTLFKTKQNKIGQLIDCYKDIDCKLMNCEGDSAGLFVGELNNPYGNIWRKEAFCGNGNESSIVTFEGNAFFAPFHYDEVLKESYGNYMALPPVEKRTYKHDYTAFWK